jgi:hypothetical protein
VPADSVQNGIFSGMDWLPTFVAAAGNPNSAEELLKGKKIGDRTYKNHLDGYNQMAAITGKGPSARHEIFYLGESTVGAVRIDESAEPLARVMAPGPILGRREFPSCRPADERDQVANSTGGSHDSRCCSVRCSW